MTTTTKSNLILGAFALLSSLATQAASLVTFTENPDAVNSSLSGTKVFDFNTLATGLNKGVKWDGVGSFDALHIMKADVYGGATDAKHADGTNYSVQGIGSEVAKTTLTLNEDSSYFGFWWSAGDGANLLEFYNDGKMVQSFTTKSLLSYLPEDYYGNPKNRKLNSNEPYAFINFYGDPKTMWDTIVFSNTHGSGFEADNYTTRVAAYNPKSDGPLPGKAVTIIDEKGSKPVIPGSLDGTYWENSAPGAPAPPLPLLLAFGVAAIAKFRKGKARKA